MSEIPEDVMRAASKWTAQCYQSETGTWFDVRDVIARAILAERRRCAAIAHAGVIEPEDDEEAGDDDWLIRTVGNGLATRIASAIEATPCA